MRAVKRFTLWTIQGAGTLQNAEYTVKYYDGQPSGSPLRTWVFRTDSDGFIYFDNIHKLSGDAFFLDSFGAPSIPAGTITIQETKAPLGYVINSEVHTVRFTLREDGTIRSDRGSWNTANALEDLSLVSEETAVCGGVRIRKTDSVTGSAQSSIGASLAGAEITVYNNCGKTITLKDGRQAANGAAVLTIRTAQDGTAQTASDALPYGTYYAKETAAPAGYAVNTSWRADFSITEPGIIVDASPVLSERPFAGTLNVTKTDSELGAAQGDASLSGIRFAVVNDSANTLRIGNTTVAGGAVAAVITTDVNGRASTASGALPYGSYRVYELRSDATIAVGDVYSGSVKLGSSSLATSSGYLFREQSRAFSIFSDGQTASAAFSDEVVKGGIAVVKTASGGTQGDVSLDGVRFAVVNMSEGPVLADGKPVGKGCVAAVITTDEAGRAATAPNCLPYGKYAVFELRADASAAVGDALNSTSGLGTSVLANSDGLLFREQSAEVTISRNGEASELSFTDEIVRGGVRISKQDRDLETGMPQGDASLEGIVFEVVNRSAAAVTVDGVSFEPGTAVMTVEAGKDGTAETPAVLPFGTYEIREKASNGSYLLTDTEGRVFRIRVDGEIVDASKGNEFRNEVVRGGVSFQKVDAETGEASGFGHCTPAGAEITIYNDSESIVVVGGKEYPPGEAVLTLTTDEEGKCGTASDALPYGSYHAEETKAPEGYRINTEWRTEFLIRENGAVIDTAEDSVLREDRIPVEIHTSARDKLSGERTGAAAGADRVTIIDTVKMKGLLPGRTYTLTAELVGRDTGPEGSPAPVCPPVAQELTTPDDLSPEDEWSVDVEIEADGSAVSGRTVVVFETLGYGGTELASHADLNDEEQTVRYQEPSVRTNAADGRTKSHEGIAAGENIIITDEVVMTGLIAGKEYTLRGRLADRNAGAPEEPVFIGDEVSKAFTAPEGIRPDEPFKVVMAFSIPEQLLRGRTVVVFESLCSGAQEIAAHADLSDEAQAVSYCSPQVRTTALDRDSKEHIGYTDGMSITICDTVRITGLAGGEEYTVIGRLIDASASSDGKTVYIDGAEETVTFRTGEGESEKTLEMTFTVDADKAVGRKVVVSETLMISDYVLAVHEDLSDEDQTVEYPEPAIRTSASAGDGSKELSPDEDGAGVIVDRVIIENIRPGTEVTAKGMLVDKKTGEPLTDEEGNAYESETTTVIKDASDSVDVIFEVEGLERFAGMDIVVFEKLFLAGTDKLPAVHEDLEDEAQTVHVPLPPDVPETGDRAEPLLYAGVMITVLMCGVLILIRRRSG